jgi:hypothetical protein
MLRPLPNASARSRTRASSTGTPSWTATLPADLMDHEAEVAARHAPALAGADATTVDLSRLRTSWRRKASPPFAAAPRPRSCAHVMGCLRRALRRSRARIGTD